MTICAQSRGINWFGEVTRDGMQLNDAGQMVVEKWNEIPQFYPRIETDAFMVMPDHIHGIIIIRSNDTNLNPNNENTNTHKKTVGADSHVRPAQANSIGDSAPANSISNLAFANGESGQTQGSVPTDADVLSLSEVMQRFKTLTTNLYIRGVRELGWLPFEKRFWERSFHDSIIRDEVHLEKTRKYILENPLRWLETRGLL